MGLKFSCLHHLLSKIDADKFEVNMANYSQNIVEKQFQRQLTVPLHKQTLLHNTLIEDGLLNRIEHEFLFYCYNLVVNSCCFYFQSS